MELYTTMWTITESVAFVIVITIFFIDPIRRWNFFGYRPTAIMGLVDPITGKVLLSRVNKAWSFNQGGIYSNNIYATVQEILQRELGLEAVRFKLLYTKAMGTVRLKNRMLTRRARLGGISIARNLRGKGYLACFIRVNLGNIKAEIHKGTGIQSTRVVSIDEARKLVMQDTTDEHQPAKKNMILAMLDEMETFASGVQNWEQSIWGVEEKSETEKLAAEEYGDPQDKSPQ